MKTRYKFLITIGSIFLFLLVTAIILNIVLYKTWGNNEHFYLPINGMEVICDVNLFTNPSNCHPVNQDGKSVAWPEDASHMGMLKFDGGYIGGGAIDLDPDLSPSYAYDFAGGVFYNMILPLGGWSVGISALFLVPYFILKRKNIPSKPYLTLILVGLLLFFSIPSFVTFLQMFAMVLSQPEQIRTWIFNPQFAGQLMPIIVLVIAGILLYKSPIIRNLLKR